MKVWELKIGLNAGAVEMVEMQLAEREHTRLLVVEDRPSGKAVLVGYYESAADALTDWQEVEGWFAPGVFRGVPEYREMPAKDWKESYREHFKSWNIGRLHWVPIWERETYRPPAGEPVLWLDPGMAFGTGNHETTRLVVERLVRFADLKGTNARVIDAGCGSGILALSAAKLGFAQVAGFDNDSVAVEVSLENARQNGLEGQVDFYAGDLRSGLAGRKAELILANIQADVLVSHAEMLIGAVAPGGWLVLSGILAVELETVRATFIRRVPRWRVESRGRGEWSDLLLADA